MRLEMCCRHLLIRVKRTLNHSAGLNVLDLRTDECCTLSRFHMLKIDNLPNASIVFNRETCAKIGAVNHIVQSSILSIITCYYSGFICRFQ